MQPDTLADTLILARDGAVLKITLNRPQTRNALSGRMVDELIEAFRSARDDEGVRVVVLKGAGGTFCAGGDLKGMGGDGAGGTQRPLAASNRRFGELLELIDALPKAVIVLVEGAAMGGGVGLIAVSDWAIADKAARIGMPEVTIGLIPAQIAPFVVARIGYAQARRLVTFGAVIDGLGATRLGLVHEVAEDHADVITRGVAAVSQCLRCSPAAVAETKRIVRAARDGAIGPLLDGAAQSFATAMAGDAREGISAFRDKRKPAWVQTIESL